MTGYIKKHMKKWLFLLAVVFLLTGCQKKLSLEEYLSTYEGETYTENYSYECSDGIPAEVQNLHPDQIPFSDGGSNMYCIYSDENYSRYAVRGYRRGILHARNGEDSTDSMNTYSEEEIEEYKQIVEELRQAWEEE